MPGALVSTNDKMSCQDQNVDFREYLKYHFISSPSLYCCTIAVFQAMARFRLITFDINNTLLRVRGSPGGQYAEVANKFGINIDARRLNKAYAAVWSIKNQEVPNYGIREGLSSEAWWSDLVKRCFIISGYRGTDYTLNKISRNLWKRFEGADAWDVIPNSRTVLHTLKNKGVVLGVISNFDERLRMILRNHDLDQYFDFIVPSVMVKVSKPDPEIFHIALDKAKVKPAEAAHVGDHVVKDYLGARNVGMSAFIIPSNLTSVQDGMEDVDQKHVIYDLWDLHKHVFEGEISERSIN